MPRTKFVDQLLLLLAGFAMSFGVYSLWYLVGQRGITNRLGFFLVFNLLAGFVVTWHGVSLFGRAPDFWAFYGRWAIAHIVIYGAWGYLGNRIEFCALTLPLEAYCFYRVAGNRFQRSHLPRSPQ